MADGRLHRLKHGKHYSTDSKTAIKAAEAAAVEMSKAVRAIEKGTAERRWGTALDPHGQRVLLIGIYWLSDGEPIADPTSPDGCRHVVQPFPIEGFRKLLDLRPLEQ